MTQKFSKTMRIDLIPDTPTEPVQEKKRIVIHKAPRASPPKQATGTGVVRESHFQEFFQSVYDAALITGLEGRIEDVNARAIEFLGYERSELRKLSIFDVISGADEGLIETLMANLESERFTLIQAYCARKDGSMFPAEIAVNEVELDNPYLSFFVRDITVRRQSEEMLRTEHNAIQNSEAGIAVANLGAQLEYVNPAAAEMLGYSTPDELTGKHLREILSDEAAVVSMVETVMENRETWLAETKGLRKDGSEVEARVSAVCNRNTYGEVVGIVLSLVNITDRIRAEEAEREAEQRRVMLQSLGAACHHLGQPATVLFANLGVIQQRLQDADPELRDLADASVRAITQLGKTLHKLNAVNEYRTTQYLEKSAEDGSEESRILDI
jgi:PAS domain S-box-containing protein